MTSSPHPAPSNIPPAALTGDRIWHRLNITRDQLTQLCETAHIAELALFGSILRDDFHGDSDIDILVTYRPTTQRGLLEAIQLKNTFEKAFKRKVDLISKNGLQRSQNYHRRDHILNSAQIIYASPTRNLLHDIQPLIETE